MNLLIENKLKRNSALKKMSGKHTFGKSPIGKNAFNLGGTTEFIALFRPIMEEVELFCIYNKTFGNNKYKSFRTKEVNKNGRCRNMESLSPF